MLFGLAMAMQMYGAAELTLLQMAEDMISNISKLTAPIKLVGVEGGSLENKYDIVETTIIIPNDQKTPTPPNQLAPNAQIRRAMVGSVGGMNSDIPVPLDNFEMKVPVHLLDAGAALDGMPEIITKVAGAVDPQAGAAAAAIGATVEITMQLATEQFNRLMGALFKTQETDMTLLELIPEKYYRINAQTNLIELTPQFKEDIVAYNKDYQEFAKVAAEYNKLLKDYNLRAIRFNTKYPYGIPAKGVSAEDQNTYNELKNTAETNVKPALARVVKAMSALQQYGMHRIAIMAINTNPGDACPDSVGPLYLYIYVFLGAKITNIYKVPYCLKGKKGMPRLVVHIASDRINSRTGEFEQGGVKFIMVDKDNNPLTSCQDAQICFPMKVGSKKVMRWESALYTWYDQIFTSAGDYGSSPLAYMLPYDIYNMDKTKEDISKAKHKEAMEKADKLMDEAVAFLKTAKAQKDLLAPKSTPSLKPKEGENFLDEGLDMFIGSAKSKISSKSESTTTKTETTIETEPETF